MPSILFDFIIILLMAFFAWRGGVRGLILSLCSLAAVFVAFFGASFLSERFCEPVAGVLRPVIIHTIREVEPPSIVQSPTEGTSYAVDELLANVRQADLFPGFVDLLDEGLASSAIQVTDHRSPVEAVAGYLSLAIAKSLLFALSYLAVVAGWFLLSHTLDLAFHLPILAQVNFAGGLVFGLVKGALLIIVLVWLGQLAGWVPQRPESPILSLFTVDRLWELLHELPA